MNWTRAMDNALIYAFMYQFNRGQKTGNAFSTNAYDAIVKEMSTLFDMEVDKGQIENRWKTLKTNFSEYHDIFTKHELSGFGWNASSGL